jgi:outer membrane protein assembly factor BamB
MRNQRVLRRLRISAALLAYTAATSITSAQVLRFGIPPTAPIELSAPQADVVSNAIANRLEQAKALAAHQEWNEFLDILTELAAEETNSVVDLGDGRFIRVRTYCHLQLARLPSTALALYRERVDRQAEQSFREGVSTRDEELLRRIVDQHFCSSWGDDALLALGEIALERADYAAARHWWGQISPLLRDPTGRPLWLALQGIDLESHWQEVERRWHQRETSPAWLAYPDTNIDLASVRARLVLASIRANELKRAAIELAAFRHFHLNSAGRLGGQDGPYAVSLERLLASAAELEADPPRPDWSTFAGSPSRSPTARRLGPLTGPAWEKPIGLDPHRFWARGQRSDLELIERRLRVGFRPAPQSLVESERALHCFPVAGDGVVYFSDALQLRAADLATGGPAITADGVLYHRQAPDGITVANTSGVPHHTLTVAGGVVYGRFGRVSTANGDERDATAGDELIGVNLRREGVLAFRARPEEASWSFDGAPVSDGRRVYVAMRRSGVMPHAYVACFDAVTSQRLWRTSIGWADTPGAMSGSEVTHNLLTLVGERIYFNTNLGLVAALDAHGGDICWIRRYERHTSEPFLPGRSEPLHFQRDPAPCLFHAGLVVVAPADTPAIFALDAATGLLLWSNDQLPDALHLLGVVRQNLIVSGNRLAALDILTGRTKFLWPESQTAGIRGMGRGLVAGDEIFWPTRHEIYVIHGVTGARSRSPIHLGTISDRGANLAAADGRLIVAAHDKIMAFGAALPVPPSRKQQNSREPIATTP